eukprot:TRINITY_DN68422_c0_g1_i1.p1 TRINITY_DN68422_c0_g1~~TRINITY_DN68422_c0_g1_i1.p1  ORF type:complete len:293 (+),score=-7.14 TRINITY_DN68422_c0_g1_i1:286-1164(+)
MALSLGITELTLSPLLYVAGGHLTQHFKRYVPITCVVSGITTTAVSGLVSIIWGHYTFNGTLSAFGIFTPESVIFTLGLGVLSYSYYGFVHQKSLSLNVTPTWLGALVDVLGYCSFGGLLTMSVFPLDRFTVLHLLGADIFFLCGTVYECLLTYTQFQERRKHQLTPHEEGRFRYCMILNGITIVSAVMIGPLVDAEHYALAAGAQCLAGGCWLLYVGTFYTEFKNLPLDSANYVNWVNGKFYGTQPYQRHKHASAMGDTIPSSLGELGKMSSDDATSSDSFVNKQKEVYEG